MVRGAARERARSRAEGKTPNAEAKEASNTTTRAYETITTSDHTTTNARQHTHKQAPTAQRTERGDGLAAAGERPKVGQALALEVLREQHDAAHRLLGLLFFLV